ncbi:hypothetical protein BDU57DRAFT_59059 [Ampelomyces quisqualis]|uniref:Secreted protein n=1 Tax=Ampelomyces quisqualis TaxID=50730 RepID=A0A6A5R4K4_AMPQU|nr:hypothetical protein BDU57DRAFT_59059 [Ampelomyces quisqualis]
MYLGEQGLAGLIWQVWASFVACSMYGKREGACAKSDQRFSVCEAAPCPTRRSFASLELSQTRKAKDTRRMIKSAERSVMKVGFFSSFCKLHWLASRVGFGAHGKESKQSSCSAENEIRINHQVDMVFLHCGRNVQ